MRRSGEAPARMGEEGSGTVNSVGLIALALTLAILLAGVGGARTASVRLQAVADLAALAGAERSATAPWEDVGSRPCEAASEVAAANGVSVECSEPTAASSSVGPRPSWECRSRYARERAPEPRNEKLTGNYQVRSMLPTGGRSTLIVIKLKESLTGAIRERECIGRLALC